MSKRSNLNISGSSSGNTSNTLFNYFSKSPATPKSTQNNTPLSKNNNSPLSSFSPKSREPLNKKSLDFGKKADEKKKKPEPESDDVDDGEDDDDRDDDDEEISFAHKRKRSRIVRLADSSDSDRENEDDNSQDGKTASEMKCKMTRKSSLESPMSKKKIKLETKGNSSSKLSFEEKLKVNKSETGSLSQVKIKEEESEALLDEPTVWLHSKLDFLKPANIRDKQKRKPSHPEYDPTTLDVPETYLNSLTPAMRQWWEIKSENFDSVLFFKVGKFYELYHMDAEVGVNELGFTYMRGEFAHSGFPEQSFDRMSIGLVERGYKVARIEQTETPDMMQERVKQQTKTTKFDKVVKREVCQVVNKGTQVFGQQVAITNDYQPNYMLAIVEKANPNDHRFGVCFIDTSIGEFNFGEFQDDKHCSRLLTLLAHNPPVLVLSERGAVSPRVSQVFKSVLAHTIKEQLLPDTQFLSSDRTLKLLAEKYFRQEDKTEWPDILKITQDPNDHLGLTPNGNYRLALKALGGCLWYLTKCIIDQQIMAMSKFAIYAPPDIEFTDEDEVAKQMAKRISNKNMVLDSITLSNLKVVGDEKSLFNIMDFCCSKFGKRLLNYWVCSPSCDCTVISERQEAVKELMDNRELLSKVQAILGALPDLERQLAQIHTFGNKTRSKEHPDGRAILFEQKQYNKKKIQDFIQTINGFDALLKLPQLFASCTSKLLTRITQLAPDGDFPDMEEVVTHFKNGFDFEEALKEGVIAPAKGVDKEFDSIQDSIAEINSELAAYLKTQEKHFGCRINYVGKDKNRFELEVPENYAKKADSRYSLEGQRKGTKPVRRFSTVETKQLLKSMQQAEEQRDNVLKDLQRRMFEKFSNNYELWRKSIDYVAILDCLTSLASYGNDQSQICFPEIFYADSDSPVIEIEDGYHPCMNAESFIPNGISLGGKSAAPLVLLTGPNMGGKSTLMRQVGLLIIMGQIGAPIPATSARFSLVERIFTRLGAQDDILAGQSTFLVELSETSSILKHATIHSLVLLDELGRGTATYDGTAIASAVVDFLANLKCRTLFSTHYHNLVDNFHGDQRISLGHMACMVENEGDTDDPTEETVTFLYKYTDGACPKSYGFNAAKLAGMPKSIIKRAHELSKKVEREALERKLFAKVLSSESAEEIREIVIKIKACTI